MERKERDERKGRIKRGGKLKGKREGKDTVGIQEANSMHSFACGAARANSAL